MERHPPRWFLALTGGPKGRGAVAGRVATDRTLLLVSGLLAVAFVPVGRSEG